MTLQDLKIGSIFKLTPNGIEWIKKTEQGLNNMASGIQTVKKFNTRAWRLSHRNKTVDQTTIIYVD